MQMVTGAAPGAANPPYFVRKLIDLPFFNGDFGKVSIAGFEPGPMIDFDHFAKIAFPSGVRDFARCGG